jgi:hypothetical protein
MTPQSARFAGAPWYGQPPRRVVALFAVIWTLLALVDTLVIHALDRPQQSDLVRIAAHPITTRGLVTLSESSNHDSFLYRYRVGQHSYTGGSYPQARVQPEAASLHVGQALSVVYDGRDPALSCACDPGVSADQNHWWQVLIAGLFLTSIVAVVATLAAARQMTRRQTARG